MIILFFAGGWYLLPVTEIPYLVVDKTVPDENYREHQAIFWLAEHWRFAGKEGRFLNYREDYIGYHPVEDRKEELSAADLQDIRFLYLADSYGVYDYEEGLEEYELRLPYEYQPIELEYGGFSYEEVEVIREFARDENNILAGEHNIFGYPTYHDLAAAKALEEVFGLKYTGWLIRYFAELDEAAYWIKELYTTVYGKEWDLSGEGLIMVREEYPERDWFTDLLVFTNEELSGKLPRIVNTQHPLLKGAADQVPYLYWTEVVEPAAGSEVLAYYEIPLPDTDRADLKQRGLSAATPAVILNQPPGEGHRIYFTGDYADQLPALLPARMTGSALIQRIITYFPVIPAEYQFFFRWYAPVLKNMMLEAGGEKD